MVTAAGMLGVVLVVAAGWAWPWPRFAATTGPHPIGTTTLAWTDTSRPEITSRDAARRRTLVAQAWYPAAPGASGPRARYLADTAFTDAIARLLGVPTWLLAGVSAAETSALIEVAPAVGRHPVIIACTGLSGSRSLRTFQALIQEEIDGRTGAGWNFTEIVIRDVQSMIASKVWNRRNYV